MSSSGRPGLIAALGAFSLWGFGVPLYLRWIGRVPAMDILAYRIFFSAIFLATGLGLSRQWRSFFDTLKTPSAYIWLVSATLLVAGNWFLFIWANTNNHLMDASLGYFLSPLMSVFLGVVVMKEKLTKLQWCSLSLAIVAIAQLFLSGHELSWLPFFVGATFAGYSLCKRKLKASPLVTSAIEVLPLALPSLAFIIATEQIGGASYEGGIATYLKLAGYGAFTIVPFYLFSMAAQRIQMSTLGFLAYLNPTLQFVFAAFVGREALTAQRMVTFAIIWAALVLFSVGNLRRKRESIETVSQKMASVG